MKTFLFVAGVVVAGATGVALIGCGGSDRDSVAVTQGTVIENATIVNTRDGSLMTGMSVIVDGGKIQKITSQSLNLTTGTAQVVDGTGKFIVPGFLDMHTHLLDSPSNEQPLVEKLFVANGITGIREIMRGSAALVQSASQVNAARNAGTITSPEILIISGATFGLNAPPAAAISASSAVAEVQAQKAYGAGFIKTINATHDAALGFLSEAKNQGLYVAGHLNPSLSALDATNAGWHAVEHLGSGMGTLLGCSTQEAAVRATLVAGNGVVPPPNPPSWSANALNAPLYQTVYDSYDNTKCQTLAQAFATNSTWHVPTLIRVRTMRFVSDPLYTNDPNLIYVSKATRAAWQAAAVQFAALPASAIATFHQYFSHEQTLPLLFKQNGVPMLAGSDTAVIANWCIPGFSLHQEFALLAAAGLTPLDILQMTTLNGATFLNRQAAMGTVDEGKNADLVLLDANPIDSAANLDKVAGVVMQGKYFPKAALDQMKSDVATYYANQTTQSAPVDPESQHAD